MNICCVNKFWDINIDNIDDDSYDNEENVWKREDGLLDIERVFIEDMIESTNYM